MKVNREEEKVDPVVTGGLRGGFITVYSNLKTTTVKPKKTSCMLRLEKLIEKYNNKVETTYDNNLSLIKVLESSDSDEETELGIALFEYILVKFSDPLTDYNFSSYVDSGLYQVGELSELNINHFKFQNLYILWYLNALFYHDSNRFQQILEDNIGANYEVFFNFLNRNLIMPSVLCEINKIYELDDLCIINSKEKDTRKTLPFEIAALTIKFLQNLCESHNQEFQSRFFNYSFDIPVKDYLYTDSYGTDMGSAKKNTRSFSAIKRIPISLMSENNSKKDIFNFADKKSEANNNINITEQESESIVNTSSNQEKIVNSHQSRKPRMIIRPQLVGEHENYGQREMYEKKKLKEKEETEWLDNKKLSFLNFICHNMRIIITHLHVDNEFYSSLLRLNRELKNYDHVLEIYQRFSDLVVEMIQGTSNKNFDNFYKKLPENLNIFDEMGQIVNHNTLDSFIYIQKSMEIKSLLFETKNPFDTICLPMKFNLFFTINNLINQELADITLVKLFLSIFPLDKIIDIVSKYARGLYIKHIEKCDYQKEEFQISFDYCELNNEMYSELIREFKNGSDIYDDEFFKLASQMYLFLNVLGEKYSIPEAEKILKLSKKEIVVVSETPNLNQDTKGTLFKWLNNFKNQLFKKSKIIGLDMNANVEKRKRRKGKHYINNLIITSKFFNKIINSCEFMIDSSNDEGDELKLKKIYFISDPRSFLISKNNLENFFDEVDRSSSTTKLKCLIDILSFFMSEVEYKCTNLKKSKYLKWMLEVEYKNVDFMNFVLSIIINLILLIFLKGDVLEHGTVYYVTISLAGVQIFINLIYLLIFLISKYSFCVMVVKSNYEKKSLSVMQWLKVHIFDSFLFNDEIYLMILNILIGCLSILSSYATFLFSLQLLTVIKFVPTIKEIVIAFKLRFSQLMSMIGFLAILIFFYSNIGFYFFADEFNVELGNGEEENLCATLLGCSITYFNHGVRAGGGIGDLLGVKKYNDTSIYWGRWIMDMIFYITVILLVLNMINGVIVSTFSQIREESNEKEEDITNKCFICNIDRVEFEKRKIAFAHHLKFEHNTKTYIRFLIYLKLQSEKDLDADQSFITECIKARDISCFPVLRSFSVGNLDQDPDEDENED